MSYKMLSTKPKQLDFETLEDFFCIQGDLELESFDE